ncbi:MAG: PEP-CTERM sorting domain-containing protein [Akkermansiaceae bacterium]|jgi:hypothetical protein|nr:PEP-CTERM sorting domain-containing protein [Akkermansiaceae bacterium]
MKLRHLLSLSLFLSPLSAPAALISFHTGATLVSGNSLSGTVTHEGWDTLNTTRINNSPVVTGQNATRPYGWHNLTNAWTSTIASNVGSGSSVFGKTGGYGYVAGSSVHQGAATFTVLPGGNFFLSGTTITDLETLVFQIVATNRDDVVFNTLPQLAIGAQTFSPDFIALHNRIDNFSTGFGGQDMDSYAFQWDLSGATIADGAAFSLTWTGLANSGIYEMQLNQGTSMVQVVPEPSTALLGLLAATGFAFRRRRA